MDLASDTCGLIKAKTSINYMHIWLVELKAILCKANFTLSFQTLFFSTSHEIIPWNASRNIFSTQVHQILLMKLAWWDLLLTSLLRYSELSVTGDTAMIIVWHSREVVHFHHLTQSTHSDLDPSWSEKERRRLRRDPSEVLSHAL